MRIPFRLILTIAALAFVPFVLTQETAKSPVLPAEARVLFATLPGEEAPWKLVESRAKSDYNSGWMQLIVTRAWEGSVLPDAPIPKVKITLSDTGGHPAFNSLFLVPGNPGRTQMEGFPAIKNPTESVGKESVCVSVGGRFLLRIETENLPSGAVKDWLKKIKTTDLQAIAARGGIDKLPNPLPMFVVDEIHPKRSRTWTMSWTDPETLRKASEVGE